MKKHLATLLLVMLCTRTAWAGASFLGGSENNGSALGTTCTIDLTSGGKGTIAPAAGNLMVVFFYQTMNGYGGSFTGTAYGVAGGQVTLPSGFSLDTELDSPLVGATHSKLYTGIAHKIATGSETSLGWTYMTGFGFYCAYVNISHSPGKDHISSVTEIVDNVGTAAAITGATATSANELVLLVGGTTAASGPQLSSADSYTNESGSNTTSRIPMFGYTYGSSGTTPTKTINDTQALEGFVGYQITILNGGSNGFLWPFP